MPDTPHARLVAYGVAVLATAATLLVRLLLEPVLEDAVPHMFFFPAVMIAAYYGGFGPGFVSTLLGALAANYFFTEPRYSLEMKGLNASIALPLFVLVGLIISGLSESEERRCGPMSSEQHRDLFLCVLCVFVVKRLLRHRAITPAAFARTTTKVTSSFGGRSPFQRFAAAASEAITSFAVAPFAAATNSSIAAA